MNKIKISFFTIIFVFSLTLSANITRANTEINLSYFGSVIGEAIQDRSSYSISSAGDVNNDGYDDILIGSYKNDAGAEDAGAAYLIYGSSTLLTSKNLSDLSVIKFSGEAYADYAGYSVSSAGDVNNDGYDDILIGAYGNDDGGEDSGATYLGYLYVDKDLDSIPGIDGLFDGADCNDNDTTAYEIKSYYQDSDQDGYGSKTIVELCASIPPTGYADNDADCDDTNNAINAEKIYYADPDEDGLGDRSQTINICSNTAPEGYVDNDKDISSIVGLNNGDIKIIYPDNSKKKISVFTYLTKKKTIIKKFPNSNKYYVALSANGRKIALINIEKVAVSHRQRLSLNSFDNNYLKLANINNKKIVLVISKISQTAVVSLAQIKERRFKILSQWTLKDNGIKPKLTSIIKKKIYLKNLTGENIYQIIVGKKIQFNNI